MNMRRQAGAPQNEAGEGRLVGALVLFAFCNGTMRTFMRSAAYALFLASVSATMLPFVYIAAGLLVSLSSFAYLQLARRLALSTLLPIALLVIVLAISLLRLGLAFGNWLPLLWALPIIYETMHVMAGLMLGNSIGRLLNVQQVKRFAGVIASGESAAAVIGGFLTAPLVLWIGTSNLLLLAALATLGALGNMLFVGHRYRQRLAQPVERRQAVSGQTAGLWRNSYVLLTFALLCGAILSYYFVDNIYYAQAQLQFPGAAELAGFIGSFNAVVAISWTLTNAFVVGRVLRRFGLAGALITAPAVLGLGTLALLAAGAWSAPFVVIFWIAVANKLVSKLGYDSFVKVSLNMIYQPLPAGRRLQVQALTEGIVYAGAIAGAGLLLLLLTGVLQLNALQLAGVLLLIVLLWMLVAWRLLREYPRQLLGALSRRSLGSGSDLQLADPGTRAVLRRALRDPQPGVALYALQMLAQGSDDDLAALLPDLLRHPAAAVRTEALRLIEQRGLRQVLSMIRERLPEESDPAVRASALRVLVVLGDAAAVDEALALLNSPMFEVRRNALSGLLRSTDSRSNTAARRALAAWAAADDPAERLLAANCIAEVGEASDKRLLPMLLADDDPAVRRAALLAAGKCADPQLWPAVIAALKEAATARAAASALSSGGASALAASNAAFATADNALRGRIALVWGRMQHAEASALLCANLEQPDQLLRGRILEALLRSNYRPAGAEVVRLQQLMRREAGRAARALAALNDIGDDCELLAAALRGEVAAARERFLLIVGLLSDPQQVARARTALNSASAEQRAYALELLETELAGESRLLAQALLANIPPGQQLQKLAPYAGPALETPDGQFQADRRAARLAELLRDSSGQLRPWTRVCAVYAVAWFAISDLSALIEPLADAPDPLLRETADWVMMRLAQPAVQPGDGNDDGVAVAPNRKGVRPVLSRIEKVLILKTVGIFAETPDEVLADVAELLEEREMPAGTRIFAQGDAGSSMYIIVNGEVRVHDGDHTLNHLYTSEVFGEMALLDPEPRVASVTTVTDTLLLQLEQDAFYQLMDERNEVAHGVIRMLTRHLRARVRDIRELRRQIGAGTTTEPVPGNRLTQQGDGHDPAGF